MHYRRLKNLIVYSGHIKNGFTRIESTGYFVFVRVYKLLIYDNCVEYAVAKKFILRFSIPYLKNFSR